MKRKHLLSHLEDEMQKESDRKAGKEAKGRSPHI